VVDEWHAPALLSPPISANRRSITATGIIALTMLFTESDRLKEKERSGIEMKKFGFAAVVASGLGAAVLGFAAPAQASAEVTVPVIPASYPSGVDHLDWLNDIQPKVNVPQVDTSVRSNP
jgi:hypothetical protein